MVEETLKQIAPLNQILIEFNSTDAQNPGARKIYETEVSECACYLTTKIAWRAPSSGNVYIDYYRLNKKSAGPFYTETVPFDSFPSSSAYYFITRPIASFSIRVRLVLDTEPQAAIPGHRDVHFYVENVK